MIQDFLQNTDLMFFLSSFGTTMLGLIAGIFIGRLSAPKLKLDEGDMELIKKTAFQLGLEQGQREGELDTEYRYQTQNPIGSTVSNEPIVRLGSVKRPTQEDLEKKQNPQKAQGDEAMRETLKDIPELNQDVDPDLKNPIEANNDPLMVDTEG